MRTASAWVGVVLAVAAAACGGARSPSEPSPPPAPVGALTPVAATDEWPSATPEAEGLDPAPLVDLVNRIHRRDYGAIHSLLVVRNGRLVVEEYFSGWAADVVHTQQSVSKSVRRVRSVDSRRSGAERRRDDDRGQRGRQFRPRNRVSVFRAGVRPALTLRLGAGRRGSLTRLVRTRGAVRMRSLAVETGISQKHLIDLFHEQVGMSPKRYARIVRLNALFKEVSSSNWADLAARFGYYDQPHFVREFRAFSGTTPTEFLRARGPDGDSVVLDA